MRRVLPLAFCPSPTATVTPEVAALHFTVSAPAPDDGVAALGTWLAN